MSANETRRRRWTSYTPSSTPAVTSARAQPESGANGAHTGTFPTMTGTFQSYTGSFRSPDQLIGDGRSGGFRSIRARLVGGFGAIMLLLAAAGAWGWFSLYRTADAVQTTLGAVQADARLSAQITTDIAQEIEAGERYVVRRDTAALAAFRRFGFAAHLAQRQMGGVGSLGKDERFVIAEIEKTLSKLEIAYARAHRLADLGRADEARRIGDGARPVQAELMGLVERLGQLKAGKVSSASTTLHDDAMQSANTLAAAIAVALLLAAALVFSVVRAIHEPLRALVAHAQELSRGNLTVRTERRMAGEFETLASAMNHTGSSLSRVVSFATGTADSVAGSARDLATVTEQISQSANQTALAMNEVTSGAEKQVEELRLVDDALQQIRERAEGVLSGAGEVATLAGTIEDSARSKRAEIDRALGILKDVRTTVQAASGEVSELSRTAEGINQFVGTVGRIAEQTNLLALNAAIEAARAGKAGRGFAVVADEVRKLAEQAQQAADEVVLMTSVITRRVESTSQAMGAGVQRVGEIERVSRDIDEALHTITAAAASTREAAARVTASAEANAAAVEDAAGGLANVAKLAEGYAATAEEVSASTQEQSAACEEMSSASAHLLSSSTQLKDIVGGLRTAA